MLGTEVMSLASGSQDIRLGLPSLETQRQLFLMSCALGLILQQSCFCLAHKLAETKEMGLRLRIIT